MYNRIRKQLNGILKSTNGPRGACSGDDHVPEFEAHRHIRLLTFNIQVGINTSSYRHYVTRSWQHFLPHGKRIQNLDRIATLLSNYDVIALQECDGGSLRSGYINQVQYLAEASGIPYWHQQLNRNLGPLAQHSNGLLSRYRPLDVTEHRLPGLIPGRGAIVARYGAKEDPLVLVMMHLSLSKAAQQRQLAYIQELISEYQHVVLMGDLNNHAEQLLSNTPLKHSIWSPCLILPTASPVGVPSGRWIISWSVRAWRYGVRKWFVTRCPITCLLPWISRYPRDTSQSSDRYGPLNQILNMVT